MTQLTSKVVEGAAQLALFAQSDEPAAVRRQRMRMRSAQLLLDPQVRVAWSVQGLQSGGERGRPGWRPSGVGVEAL